MMGLPLIVLVLALLALHDLDGSQAAKAIAQQGFSRKLIGGSTASDSETDTLSSIVAPRRSVRSTRFGWPRSFRSMFSDRRMRRRFQHPFQTGWYRPHSILGSWGGSSYRPQRPYRNRNEIEGFVKKYAAYVPLVIKKGKVEIPEDDPKPTDSELTRLKTYCSWYPSLCEEVALDVMNRLPKRRGKGKEVPKTTVRPKKPRVNIKEGSVKELQKPKPKPKPKPKEKYNKEKQLTFSTSDSMESTTQRLPTTTRRSHQWRIYSFETRHRKPISELFDALMGYIFGDRKESIHDIMEKFVKKYSSYVTMVYDGSHLIRPSSSNSILKNLFRCCGRYPELCDEVIKTTTVAPTKPTTSDVPSTTLETERIVPLPESSGDDYEFIPEVPPAV